MTITATGGDRRITVDAVTRVISITPAASGGGVTDHGALTGLTDDDHAQYALADGSRGDFATTEQGGKADTATQPGDLGTAAPLNVGTTAGTVAAGDDTRLSDARTPTSHATSHQDGGADELAIDASQVTTGTIATARLGSGTADSSTILYGDQTYKAAPSGGGIVAPGNTKVLAPRTGGRGWAFYVDGGTITPAKTRAAASMPFTVPTTCTLTGLALEVVAGSASATHILALYACDGAAGPGALVTAFTAFDCATSGVKTLTGLTQTITAGSIYVLVSVPGATVGHTVRGLATGTSGLSVSSGLNVTETASLGTGGDNIQRGSGWQYAPAVAGTPDASPTWVPSGYFLEIPNIGLVLA